MKQVCSVFMLLARSSVYKIMAILAAMAAAECALFGAALQRGVPEEEGAGLELLLRASGVLWAFGAAALAVTVVLALTGCAFSTKTGYTLRRLSVSERQIACLQMVYNLLAYLILWGAQLAVAWGLCRWFAAACPDQMSSQTIFLAFYRSSFLHPLMPLQNGPLWACNGLVLVTLAVTAAAFPYRQRRGRRRLIVLPLAFGLAAATYPSVLGEDHSIMLWLCCPVLLGAAVYSLWEEATPDE